MCDAMHFAEELSGRFRNDRASLPAIAISDASHITCVGNDYGFDHIFSRYVQGIGKPGDILLAISTSGNSKNINNAAKAAKEKGMHIVAMTGKTGGELASIADVELRASVRGLRNIAPALRRAPCRDEQRARANEHAGIGGGHPEEQSLQQSRQRQRRGGTDRDAGGRGHEPLRQQQRQDVRS